MYRTLHPGNVFFFYWTELFLLDRMKSQPKKVKQLLPVAPSSCHSTRMASRYGMVDVYDGYLAAEASRSLAGGPWPRAHRSSHEKIY